MPSVDTGQPYFPPIKDSKKIAKNSDALEDTSKTRFISRSELIMQLPAQLSLAELNGATVIDYESTMGMSKRIKIKLESGIDLEYTNSLITGFRIEVMTAKGQRMIFNFNEPNLENKIANLFSQIQGKYPFNNPMMQLGSSED